ATTFILLFAALAPTVQADDGRTYKVGTNVLNVRSAPSHSANVVGHLMSGDQAVVFQEKHGWAQTYYDGQVAWVAAHYLYPAENNTAVHVISSGGDHNTETQPAKPTGTLNGYTIVLDPGHGGKDPGAIG